MKRFFQRLLKRGRVILCVLLATALVTGSLNAAGIAVTASGEERRFDVGVNPESVTAVLGENGVLTVSGSGAIRDFTPETAPFADCPVRSIKLGADINTIGDYAFYNCGSLTGAVSLPQGLIRIGTRAFSGDSPELAPKPDFVENPFTERKVTRKKESDASESDGSHYLIETIVQQEIGEEPFYPVETSASFVCSAENETFRTAMKTAGYREAQSVLSAAFDGGQGEAAVVRNLPVVDGMTVLPGAPPEITPPEGDGLFAYAFGGWTESQDAANTVRAAGSAFPAEGRGELYFIANWVPELLAKITAERQEDGVLFAVPEIAGYDILSFRWQLCPAEETPSGGEELLPWEDIAGETGQTYLRKWEPEDGGRLFRCVITVKKQQNMLQALFSAEEGQEMALSPVDGASLAPEPSESPANEEAAPNTGETSEGSGVPQAAAPAAESSPLTQSAGITGGRSFAEVISGGAVTVTPHGAVTAEFTTEYDPPVYSADSVFLSLYQTGTGAEGQETIASCAFPAGAKIILGDRTSPAGYRYYYLETAGGLAKISLDQFTSGGTAYAASGSDAHISEKLLFAVDFSASGMPAGNYFMALEYGSGRKPEDAVRASFSVAEAESCALELVKEDSPSDQLWRVTLTPRIPGTETRYAGGACIRVYLNSLDGKTIGFPSGVTVTGGDGLIYEQDGSVTFTLHNNIGTPVTFDFSGVPETVLPRGDYMLNAVMSPQAGLQLSTNEKISDDSVLSPTFTLAEQPAEQQRSIDVSLQGEGQRLLDVSSAPGELMLLLEYRGTQAGDSLEVDFLRKEGSTPDVSSYAAFASGDWVISPAPGEISGSSSSLSVTVPQNQEKGTYRVRFRIVDASGNAVAEEPYNFIVK